MSETVSGTTIYQRIGGEAAISAAVDRFYERVLDDPTLSHFFSGVSMARLKAHQFGFLSQALGGPKQYSGAVILSGTHTNWRNLVVEEHHFPSEDYEPNRRLIDGCNRVFRPGLLAGSMRLTNNEAIHERK
jgi:hypothetical protein